MAKKHVFSYGAGKAEAKGADLTKNVLGGKGIGLMEMTSIGINVPAGFTVSIQTCAEYYKLGRKLPSSLEEELRDALKKLEKVTGKKLGDANDPFLVSVRSGAARSMPGMLETILNLGLNDKSCRRFGHRKPAIRVLRMIPTAVLSKCIPRRPWAFPSSRWKICCMR